MEVKEWYEEGGALNLKSGAELEQFDLGTVLIGHTRYTVLTGYEGTGRCFWCGAELKGSKLKWYCRGHMKEYYRHFKWRSARNWCCERQNGICANCGKRCGCRKQRGGYSLEVHHIVPLQGGWKRYFSAYNLPWNLIGLCHDCHQEVHAAMRPPRQQRPLVGVIVDSWIMARSTGQAVMDLVV
jgi:hypothetical protein